METYQIVLLIMAVILLFIILIILLLPRKKEENNLLGELTGKIKEENFNLSKTIIKENSDLKLELANSIGKSSKENIKDLNEFKEGLNKEILENFESLNNKIEQQMDRINKKVEFRLSEGFEKTNKTFTNIVERLTKIDEAQKNIEKLSTDVVSLQNVLTDKKSRGTFGEVQLNHILTSIFGEKNDMVFEIQATLSNGKIADALIHIPDPMGDLAVDSKFPLENYQRMIDKEATDREIVEATRKFKSDLKKHIDDIASKYIIPTETSDQAIMFIPAEAIFAELNAYHQDIIDYAQRKRVWIASPTTLMSLLTTVQVLLRNVKRDKHIKVIQRELVKLGDDFTKYQTRWDKLSRSIDTVNKSVKDIHITTNKIGKRFNEISQVQLEEKEESSESTSESTDLVDN
ncbi:MAG: DNA recombination protein RmuC [Candidatus Izimaplasma bacterium HR2]|nr:MAG: DNA recombination protein RmuC [Candidatus Izimaplasma bacterium HR2]